MKKICYFCISLLLVPLLAVVALYFAYTPFEGVIHLSTIHGAATIVYESEYSIPYINGTTNEAVAYALGYAQAENRLYDLQLKRAVSSGRVAELFGKDALDLDKYFRSLQFDPIIDAEYEALSPANKSFLQAYADGVNAYVKTARIFPIEFKLIGMDFAPWTVKDSLHVFKLLSFMMASHWQLTSVRSGIADKYGPELAELLVPFREKDSFFDEVTIIPETGEKKKQEKAWEKKPATPEELKAKINGSVFKELPQHIKSNTLPKGSNAWAVHGNHTVSGKPILSNDPHLAHGIPSEFYMVALKYPQGPTITGATLSGLPLIVIGRNEKVAWGVTMSLIENVDLYNIKLNTEKTHYFYNGAWKPLKIRQEIIKVKGGEPIKYLVYATHHGPIMDYPLKPELGLLFAIGGAVFMDKPVAMAWAGLQPNDRSIEAAFKLNWATSTKEMAEAAKLADGLVASVVFTTSEGDIGYWATGKIPVRKNIMDAFYARDGSLAKNDWTAFYPPEQNPHAINPAQGFIVSCNNRINSGEEFNSVGTTVPTTPRAVRATQHLTELLRSGKKVSVSDMQKLQLDVIDVYGERLAPLMLKVVDKYEAELLEKDPARREIVKRMTQGLRGWNGETAMDSKSALIFSVWREQLGALMLKAYFTNEYERNSVMTSFFIDHFVGKQVKAWSEGKNIMSNFCAESFSSVKSLSCAHVVVQALLNAHALLVGELGSNEAQWKWGRHHILQYKHMPLSQTPLKIFFQREVPSPGCFNTLFMSTMHKISDKAESACGPVLRLVADMDGIENTHLIGDVGQSTNIFSKYYSNFIEAHINGRYQKYQKRPEGRRVDILP